ncbi:hypothetical protein F4861DRAFT_543698 [Xylaria intraflava]|nr:hypothetical protein F4861DRAFT_543698 [Xylaria intraflava]
MNLPTESGTRSSPRSASADEASKSALPRSQPIAIELPAARKVNGGLAPAPLSARGDAPGGYFPFHEDHIRVYHHHPFQFDATRAHMESVQRASQDHASNSPQMSGHSSMKKDAGPATINVPPTRAERTTESPLLDPASGASVASYIPHGDQNSHLPVGRYYPTNYENRKEKKARKAKDCLPTTSEPATSKSAVPDSQVPNVHQPSTIGHPRDESEAKRRLQQYQRDMVAQATIALNRGNVNQAALSSIRSLGLGNVAGPSKPRLVPLGSPGPVTPMELEGPDGGYIGAHGLDDSRPDLNCVNKSGEPGRQEGDTSPR